MCRLLQSIVWLRAFCICAFWLITVSLAGYTKASEAITLDPVCQMPESRNPVLPPGNPAPSTGRMAQRLQQIYENASLGTFVYMSERIASMLERQITNATDAGEKLELQFKLSLEQMQAGHPDQALNTIAGLERWV